MGSPGRIEVLSAALHDDTLPTSMPSIRPLHSMTPTPPRATAATFLILVVAAFALYAWTAAPTVLFGDSGEMQIVGAAGGIPHATGYPGFVLASRALVWLGWG